MRVLLLLLFITLTGASNAGCIYICENGLSCMMSCDNGSMMTVPDPANSSYKFRRDMQEFVEEEASEYKYDSEYDPRAHYSNEGVNDLPNSPEPDTFTMDFESLEEEELIVTVCDYYQDEIYCRDL